MKGGAAFNRSGAFDHNPAAGGGVMIRRGEFGFEGGAVALCAGLLRGGGRRPLLEWASHRPL